MHAPSQAQIPLLSAPGVGGRGCVCRHGSLSDVLAENRHGTTATDTSMRNPLGWKSVDQCDGLGDNGQVGTVDGQKNQTGFEDGVSLPPSPLIQS